MNESSKSAIQGACKQNPSLRSAGTYLSANMYTKETTTQADQQQQRANQ